MDSDQLMKNVQGYQDKKCTAPRKSLPVIRKLLFKDPDQTWRDGCQNTWEMMAKARQRELFVDVHFLVGQEGSNVRNFSAHKLILACGSPVFEAMFFGQLAETKDPIPLPCDDPQAFNVMLRYLYGQKNIFPSIVVACKTYYLADKYLIPQLQEESAAFIELAEMDDFSFWGIIEGNLFYCKNAEEKLKKYLQVYACRLLRCYRFLKVPKYIVDMILQMDGMDITELELLRYVSRWGQKRPTIEFQDLLRNIRFSTLTPKEFCRFHECFPDVLDSATCLKILKHLNDPNTYNPPDWCSRNNTWRHMRMMNINAGSLFTLCKAQDNDTT